MTKFVDMSAELIQYTSSPELMVVNAARVSHGKWASELTEKDIKLIKFLFEHKHFSPFRHIHFTFRLKMPLFIRSQFTKHRLGIARSFSASDIITDDFIDIEENEISRRYVDAEIEFYKPYEWREQGNVKQGQTASLSDKKEITFVCDRILEDSTTLADEFYKKLLMYGVTQEQARMILPQNLMTQVISTFSFQALYTLFNLRIKSNAQKEFQDLAIMMQEEIKNALGDSILVDLLESA